MSRETRYVVCPADDVPAGQRRIIEVNGKSIGVFNLSGSYYALLNRCPHQGAPLCSGHITGTMLPSKVGTYNWSCEGRILRCPWHGWEFDIMSGRSVFNPHRVRVRTYDVQVEPADPSVQTFPVAVEQEMLVVYV